MKRANKIALAGIMGAIASVLIIGAVYLPVTFTLSIVASFVVVTPALVYDKSLGYCIAIAAVAAGLSTLISGNFFYVLPFLIFFAPYLIVKVYVDRSKMAKPFKWLVKYAVLELALGLLMLLTYFLFFGFWTEFTSISWFLWVFLLAPQVLLIPYDFIAGTGVKYLATLLKKRGRSEPPPPPTEE